MPNLEEERRIARRFRADAESRHLFQQFDLLSFLTLQSRSLRTLLDVGIFFGRDHAVL